MAILSNIKPHFDAVDYFKELPFYNTPTKKPKVKRLKNIDRWTELSFYEQLSVIISLKKYNLNGETEFAPVYFNSVAKKSNKSRI